MTGHERTTLLLTVTGLDRPGVDDRRDLDSACQGELGDLKKGNVVMSTPAFIATVGGAVVLAIGAGIAIGVAASGKKP